MRIKLTIQWQATDESPESTRGERAYLREDCHCGQVVHDLATALRCGVLTDVRKWRKMDGEDVGHEIGVSANTVYRWGRGEEQPSIVALRRALEDWLCKDAVPVSAEPATASGGENQP